MGSSSIARASSASLPSPTRSLRILLSLRAPPSPAVKQRCLLPRDRLGFGFPCLGRADRSNRERWRRGTSLGVAEMVGSAVCEGGGEPGTGRQAGTRRGELGNWRLRPPPVFFSSRRRQRPSAQRRGPKIGQREQVGPCVLLSMESVV